MKWRILVLLALLGVGAIAPAANASDQIIEAQGRVEIKRSNASGYQSAAVGTQINIGDLIRPVRGAQVVVQCANQNLWSVPAGIASGLGAGCPASVSSPVRGLGARGESDFLAFLNGDFVYATQVLNRYPLLQWEPVPNARQYQIQIKQGGTVVWQIERSAAENPVVRYEGEGLQAGILYQLVVTAVGFQGAERSTVLAFQLMNDSKLEALEATIVQIESQELSAEGKAIALASAYRSATQINEDGAAVPGLLWEAIAALEPLVPVSETAYTHQMLGDALLQVGLLDKAEMSYRRAISLSQGGQNREIWTAAQVGLANVAAARGDRTAARESLLGAKVGYLLLQEGDRADLMSEWLSKLNL
ncbi:hypothetical protein IFO70_34400 [Phormidium tenue FACHB-886]|nr:hypothetical protein [Phormidium tenue FACHB-886]